MKYVTLSSIAILMGALVPLAWATPAFAHVLQTDGTMGVVMHVDPNDDPIAQSPATFFFEFKDTSGKFASQYCDCAVTISEGSMVILTQSLFASTTPGQTTASLPFMFPRGGVYAITVRGVPKAAGAFAAFAMHFDVRVENPSAPAGQNFFVAHLVHLGIVFGGVMFMLGAIGYDQWKRRRASQQKGV